MDSIIIPKTVETQMIQFCSSLRAINFLDDNHHDILYRKTIRDTIHEILDKTFPLLSNELSDEKKNNIVNSFLLGHHAKEAEFHKIATELAYFFQNNDFLDSALRCLVEYEWLLYHIEVTDNMANTYTTRQYCSNDSYNMELRLNPTLKFIKLPFLIQDGTPIIQHSGEFIYGLFKNSKNEILRKRLLAFDLSILNSVVDKKISLIVDLEKTFINDNKITLHEWIAKNIVEEFVFLS